MGKSTTNEHLMLFAIATLNQRVLAIISSDVRVFRPDHWSYPPASRWWSLPCRRFMGSIIQSEGCLKRRYLSDDLLLWLSLIYVGVSVFNHYTQMLGVDLNYIPAASFIRDHPHCGLRLTDIWNHHPSSILVGGWGWTPLKKILESQLGWWNSQYMGK